MNKRILVWGTGKQLNNVLGECVLYEDILGFIDNNPEKVKTGFLNKRVYSPSEIIKIDFDAIVVATIYSEEIEEQCQELGIDLSKVIHFLNPKRCTKKEYQFFERNLGTYYANLLTNPKLAGIPMSGERASCRSNIYYLSDYTRYQTLKFVSEEIEHLSLDGAVAEVGVFRGDFAAAINSAFPDRKLFLFDTFEGFDPEEIIAEKNAGNCNMDFAKLFAETSVDLVMKKMPLSDNIVIKKGLFPNSLEGLDENFVFVSIDVDFEKSIYDSLDYFYPRLVKGGYIFLHDYNSALFVNVNGVSMYLQGVKRAIRKYETDNNINLCKVPLPDQGGTLVITK